MNSIYSLPCISQYWFGCTKDHIVKEKNCTTVSVERHRKSWCINYPVKGPPPVLAVASVPSEGWLKTLYAMCS